MSWSDWRQRNHRNKTRKLLRLYIVLYGVFALLCATGLILTLNTASGQISGKETIVEARSRLPVAHEVNLQQKIKNYASVYGVNAETALRITDCESKTGLMLFNKESSAKGIYQFVDKTWKNYCEGNVLNTDDNISCFMKLYNQHPNWWKCK